MDSHPFKMPFAPVTNYVTIVFLIMVLIGMWFNDDTRISLIVGIVFLGIIVISFYGFKIGERVPVTVFKLRMKRLAEMSNIFDYRKSSFYSRRIKLIYNIKGNFLYSKK